MDYEELKTVMRLANKRLPGDVGFKWPSPTMHYLRSLDIKKEPMEITRIIEPVPVERRDVRLAFEEIEMLVDALNGYYVKYMNKIARTEQPRSKKESIELGKRQELFQRLARIRNEWENGGHPDYPENVNQP